MKRIKNNWLVRGLYFLFKRNFICNKGKFGYIANNVVITPPLWIGRKSNVFLFEKTNLAANSWISALNARFIVKQNCSIAEG